MITKRKMLIQMADPAGNKTAFVLNGARREEYRAIAKYILEKTDTGAEQVAFVKSADSIDMSGMEFCGNAARAFALMTAKGLINGKKAEEETTAVPVTVSGRDHPVVCVVNTEHDYTKIVMPLPKRIRELKSCSFKDAEGCTVIVLDGITHLIAEDIDYTEENFEAIKEALIEQFDSPAVGVMYLSKDTLEMTPVVHVSEVGSTYIEGSCGSGTTAAAVYLAQGKPDGEYFFDIKQPAGTIRATAVVKDGELSSVYLEGPVKISDPELIEVEYESDENEVAVMADTW